MKRNISFEPSREAKKMYLATRKKETIYGGFSYPGLFNTYDYSKDTWFFFAAILLEIFGIGIILFFGNFDPDIAILIAVLALVLDLTFAYIHHLPQSKIQEINIELLLEDNDEKQERLENNARNSAIKKNLLSIPIMIIALSKIFLFYVVYGDVDIVLIAIIVSYCIVAVIHIKNTGFFFSEYRRRIKEKRERKRFLNSNNSGDNYRSREVASDFISKSELKLLDQDKFGLEKSEGKYRIFSNGILYDAQLQRLIDCQNKSEPTNAYLVAREGLKHQFFVVLENQTVLR